MEKNVREVCIEFQIDESEYVNYNFRETYKRPSIIFLAILGVMMFIYTLLVAYVTFSSGHGITLALVLMSALTAYLFYIPFKVKRLAQKAFRTNKFAHGVQQMCVSDKGISGSSETGCSKFGWDMLYKAQETKNMFVLYLDQYRANMVPKRCFKSEREIDLVREILKDNLSPKQFKR